MNTLEISGFKAFGNRLFLDFGPGHRNMVIYGENGSGKSSICDALRMAFFHDRLLAEALTIGASPEQRSNEESDFYFAYRHRPLDGDMDIRLDGHPMNEAGAPHRSLPCFILDCHAADCPTGTINLSAMMGAMMQNALPNEAAVSDFVQNHAALMADTCNRVLTNEFVETIHIGIEDDSHHIYIEDTAHGLRTATRLGHYFNEAKLHLVCLLLQLVAIRLMTGRREGVRPLLVMDDVVTSLDASNRCFLIRHLLTTFGDMQVVVLTHNPGFNNVFHNLVREAGLEEGWLFANLYLNAGGPHVYDYTRMLTATGIKEAFNSGSLTTGDIGTAIRRRFEALLLEVCKIVCIGASEEASTLLNRLLNPGKPIYVCKRGGKLRVADDLVQDIAHLAAQSGTPAQARLLAITQEINTYATERSLGQLVPIIRQFHMYEKLVLHELSHGYTAMPPFNQKEVEASLVLLEKMEQCVRSLRTKNAGM